MRKIILASVLILISIQVFANKEAGNGGTGVACYTDQKILKSVELFDLWEAQGLEGLVPLASDVDALTLAANKIMELEKTVSDSGTMSAKLVDIKNRMEMLATGFRLALTGDVNTILSPTANCEFVQIINFENNGRIFVASDFWQKLDNVHQAALLVHEVVYSYLREASSNETDSSRVRRIVSLTFAGKKLETAMRDPYQHHYQCSEDNSSRMTTRFWIYNDENSNLRIEFYYTLGKMNFDRTSLVFKDDPAYRPIALEDFEKPGSFGITGQLHSHVDRDYNFSLLKENSTYTIYIENSLTRESVTTKLLCWME